MGTIRAERTKLRTWVAALSAVILAILLMVLGGAVRLSWLSILLYNIGSFLLASVVIALIFEFWQLKIFLEELFEEAKITDQVRRARILGFSTTFHDGVAWEELFERSSQLDILFVYGSTWRNTHQHRLEKLLARPRSRLGVVLPDRENTVVLAEMAERFGRTPEDLRARIQEAEEFFRGLAERLPGEVTIYALGRSPTFTFYRFNTKAVFTTYRHSPGKGGIITMVVDREGEFYEWIRAEWHGITREGVRNGMTRVLFTKPSSPR